MKEEEKDMEINGHDPRLDAFWLLFILSLLAFQEPSGSSLWSYIPNVLGFLALLGLLKLVKSPWFQELFPELKE